MFAENCSFDVPGPRTAQLEIKARFLQWDWPKNIYISFKLLFGLFKPVLVKALFLSILKGETVQQRQVDCQMSFCQPVAEALVVY